MKPLSITFLWCCLLCCIKWFITSESADEIPKCDQSNGSYGAIFHHDGVCCVVQNSSDFLVC